MEIQKKPSQKASFRMSLYTVRFLIAFFAVFAVFLPYILRNFTHFTVGDDTLYSVMIGVIYVSYVPIYTALVALHKLLINIRREILFADCNVAILGCLSWCCLAVGIIYGLFSLLYVWSLFAAILGCFMWLILRVLKNVFEQAVYIKHENDLTV